MPRLRDAFEIAEPYRFAPNGFYRPDFSTHLRRARSYRCSIVAAPPLAMATTCVKRDPAIQCAAMYRGDFWTFRTGFSFQRARGVIPRDVQPAEAYQQNIKSLLKENILGAPVIQIPMMRSLAEWSHHHFQKPYCKVHPGMAAMLTRTNLDELPCDTLTVPLPVFEIRLPMQDNPIQEHEHAPALRSVMVVWDMLCVPEMQTLDWRLNPDVLHEEAGIAMFFDFGEEGIDPASHLRAPVTQYLVMNFLDGETIGAAFDRLQSTWKVEAGYNASTAFIRSVMGLVIAACFFVAEKHEVVAPDIAPRFVERYRRAKTAGKSGEKEIDKLIEQSKKLGFHGWHVGREVELPRPIVVNRSEPEGGDAGERHWESRFSHVRSGHMRWQHYGSRENPERKLIFIPPTIVRPDLPPLPTPTRYRIPDPPKPDTVMT